MKINIETIPHDQHRYETVGDYWLDENGVIQIRVSEMDNDDYEFLVAIHELIEQKLCSKRGIKEEDISKFDIEFEANRAPDNNDEPGDETNSPYQNEHLLATGIEKILCSVLNIKWKDYDNTILNL